MVFVRNVIRNISIFFFFFSTTVWWNRCRLHWRQIKGDRNGENGASLCLLCLNHTLAYCAYVSSPVCMSRSMTLCMLIQLSNPNNLLCNYCSTPDSMAHFHRMRRDEMLGDTYTHVHRHTYSTHIDAKSAFRSASNRTVALSRNLIQ